jgi:hypothetical protein
VISVHDGGKYFPTAQKLEGVPLESASNVGGLPAAVGTCHVTLRIGTRTIGRRFLAPAFLVGYPGRHSSADGPLLLFPELVCISSAAISTWEPWCRKRELAPVVK